MTLENTLAGVHPLGFLFHTSLLQPFTPRLGLIATLFVILVAHYARSPWRRVPPGPKGLPILGNALQLQDKGWMYAAECKRKFGMSYFLWPIPSLRGFTQELLEHMMYLNVLGQPILVIHSLKTAFELLDRRSNIYSDRPRYVVAHDILCGGLFSALIPYGDVLVYIFFQKFRTYRFACSWRRTRRVAHEVLTKAVVSDYHLVYRKEAIILAVAILKNPNAFDKHVQRCSASATMSILYDYPTLENEDDKTLTGIHMFINHLSAASAPGAHLLVELFPWMIYIPER
jgi:hypothetical protein